jgi:multidrug efflux pump subunit AcrA (membrane-fusion protein)
LPVVFTVDNTSGALKAGMLVRGRILSGGPERGLVVPSRAVVDEDGLLVAYVQIGGETFERRAVTVGATDGAWTVVRSGVRPGERVVTLGQYQIKLSALNTSEISDHGHPH